MKANRERLRHANYYRHDATCARSKINRYMLNVMLHSEITSSKIRIVWKFIFVAYLSLFVSPIVSLYVYI